MRNHDIKLRLGQGAWITKFRWDEDKMELDNK